MPDILRKFINYYSATRRPNHLIFICGAVVNCYRKCFFQNVPINFQYFPVLEKFNQNLIISVASSWNSGVDSLESRVNILGSESLYVIALSCLKMWAKANTKNFVYFC